MHARTLLCCAIACAVLACSQARASTCYGTWNHGRLEDGVQLPASGANYAAYSRLGVWLGRTYMHADVRATILDAYASLAKTRPDTHYVYGESGFAEGGRIRPHRTHQNGLAVDFFVPVRDALGRSAALPAGIGNKFGYGIEFTSKGRFEGYGIDFEAIADHLLALDDAARRHHVGIALVIIDPAFVPFLRATRHGAELMRRVAFTKRPAWVRHDEHYHVYFTAACRPMADTQR